MSKQKLFSKEFFAERYGFEPEQLSYAIGYFKGVDIDEKRPVMLIDKDDRFINILEHALHPKKLPGILITFEECNLKITEEGYVWGEKEFIYTHEMAEAAYTCLYNI